MKKFSKKVSDDIRYYVYRLIDPRNGKTFYVGKGKGNRVFEHVQGELHFSKRTKDEDFVEDEVSAKIQTIRDIHAAGKEVLHIIHRYGMEENEAFEVEAALIDIYDNNLTNLQSGHAADRGLISTDSLIKILDAPEFVEPNEINYIIIKIKESSIDTNSIYEATRRAWRISLNRAKNYPYVLSTINGIVKEVFKVNEWYQSKNLTNRIEFDGDVVEDKVRRLFIGKKLPAQYRTKGCANPAQYKR